VFKGFSTPHSEHSEWIIQNYGNPLRRRDPVPPVHYRFVIQTLTNPKFESPLAKVRTAIRALDRAA